MNGFGRFKVIAAMVSMVLLLGALLYSYLYWNLRHQRPREIQSLLLRETPFDSSQLSRVEKSAPIVRWHYHLPRGAFGRLSAKCTLNPLAEAYGVPPRPPKKAADPICILAQGVDQKQSSYLMIELYPTEAVVSELSMSTEEVGQIGVNPAESQ